MFNFSVMRMRDTKGSYSFLSMLLRALKLGWVEILSKLLLSKQGVVKMNPTTSLSKLGYDQKNSTNTQTITVKPQLSGLVGT